MHHPPVDQDGARRRLGGRRRPDRGALLVAALKAGIVKPTTATRESSTRSRSAPTARRCRSSSASRTGHVVMYTKGAPEVVLAKCTRVASDGESRAADRTTAARVLQAANAMAARALRVLAGLSHPRKAWQNASHEREATWSSPGWSA